MSNSESINLKELREQLYYHLRDRGLCSQQDTLSLFAHGEANVIFRLNSDRLIRVAVNSPNQRFEGDFTRLTAFESKILNYLKGTGLTQELITEQLQSSNDFPYTYLMTDYLSGQPMDYSRRHLQQCAQTLAKLHRLPEQPGYENVQQLTPEVEEVTQPLTLFFQESQNYAQPYFEASEAEPEIIEMLQSVLAKAEQRLSSESLLATYPHQCLVHGDHTYENWVINDEHAYLIDWEWAEIGSPAGDLGHFLSPVTIQRFHDYQMPAADQQFFLEAYYQALGDSEIAKKMKLHFSVFGAFPALRSLCWTAGYWITARLWYADAVEDSESASRRLERLQRTRQQFKQMWEGVMALLDEPLP